MTSEIEKIKNNQSVAMQNLNYARGKERVKLSDLDHGELEALIEEQIDVHDLRELNGFVELRNALPSAVFGTERRIITSATVKLECTSFSEELPFELTTHVLMVSRRLYCCHVYKHYETGEETSDADVYSGWSMNEGYLRRGEETILFLRRLPEGIYKEPVLVLVSYSYEKVVKENHYLIQNIKAMALPAAHFSACFGKDAPQVAHMFFSELASAYRQTANHLYNKARAMRDKSLERESFTQKLSY